MNLSEFTANYAQSPDDELLLLWTERSTLVPEAATALERELQKRGLEQENAPRVKKRLDALAAREAGPLSEQVAAAKNERGMRHFVGWEEPEFVSPYGARDFRNSLASARHRYQVWKSFRDHTGRWPVLSICFHFLSWMALIGFLLCAFVWMGNRRRATGWEIAALVGGALILLGARDMGARLMRKLDWKRCNR